jgi:DNA repair protein RadA/Sms
LPGSLQQLRRCCLDLVTLAKTSGTAVAIVGHVTKEGDLAGPKLLEHLVDVVLAFEGDRHHAYRILRAVKNRFGSTDEIGIFEMREDGLQPVENASAALLAEREAGASGSSVTALLEGSRPLLIEAQALVSRSFLAAPRRSSNGVDINRANMLLAVLEKRVGLRLGDQDVFINVAGGVRLNEPSADLAVVLAVASSFRDQPVDAGTVLIGEVGLGGEIRSVPRLDKRVREAARMDFSRVVTARHGVGALPKVEGIKVAPAATVSEAIALALTPASRAGAVS